ncbi:hypothetical protein CHI10_15895 [Bacillus sp. 7894-2]|nr:hypothetical protein CHI10_15895 [Bacillus sp. 7894-2]
MSEAILRVEDRLFTGYFCLKLLWFGQRTAVFCYLSPKLARVLTQNCGIQLFESEVGPGSDTKLGFSAI